MTQRQHPNAELRPLIFLCHGFGGLLLQRALALTTESNSTPVSFQTLRQSTAALLFAGVPHRGICHDALGVLYSSPTMPPNQLVLDLSRGSDLLEEIGSFFKPMLKNFRIINFWEQVRTDGDHASAFIVEETSAAPMLYSMERSGIMSNHASLLTFSSPRDPGFALVSNALESCIKDCARSLHNSTAERYTDVVTTRGPQSQTQGHNMWQNEITGRAVHMGDVYVYNTIESGSSTRHSEAAAVPSLLDMYGKPPTQDCQMYKVDRRSSPQFTGRRLQAQMLSHGLASPTTTEERDKHKVAVIYGLGGSGKTQFCLRFAEQHQNK